MTFTAAQNTSIRDRFAHVDACPFTGPRIFFENAGGALTLKSAVETSTKFAAIPDNQGRDNPAASALGAIIQKAKADMAVFFNAPEGQFFVGESGTELSFRLIRTMIMGTPVGSIMGSSVEHPASRSAAQHWAEMAGKPYINVQHDNALGQVTAAQYAAQITPDVRVATILHTSPVTGIANDVAGIAAAIRAKAPDAFICSRTAPAQAGKWARGTREPMPPSAMWWTTSIGLAAKYLMRLTPAPALRRQAKQSTPMNTA